MGRCVHCFEYTIRSLKNHVAYHKIKFFDVNTHAAHDMKIKLPLTISGHFTYQFRHWTMKIQKLCIFHGTQPFK